MSQYTPENPLFLPASEAEFGLVAEHVANVVFDSLPVPFAANAEDLKDMTAKLAGFEQGYEAYQLHLSENPVFEVEESVYTDILKTAIQHGAQSFIIEASFDGYRSTLYVNGEHLLESKYGAKNGREKFFELVGSASAFVSTEMGIEDSASRQFEFNDKTFNVRIDMMEGDGFINAIMTRIEQVQVSQERTLEDIGITELDEVRSLKDLQSGIVLIAGRRGSGKTETYKALARELVEVKDDCYQLVDHNNLDIGLTEEDLIREGQGSFTRYDNDEWASMTEVMRRDPRVIFCPEVRSAEQLKKLVRASESGALVVATITQNSIKAVLQAVNMLCENDDDVKELRTSLAQQLKGIVVQNLVRKSCPKCAGEGCVHCNQYGNVGHTAISEVVTFSDMYQVFAAATCTTKDQTWTSMYNDALNKFQAGEITESRMSDLFGESFDYWLEAQA